MLRDRNATGNPQIEVTLEKLANAYNETDKEFCLRKRKVIENNIRQDGF